jgi:hypothetical protein
MVTMRMRSFEGFRRLPFLLAVLAALMLMGASAAGQPAPAGFSPSQLKLKGIIEARYRAYAIQDGILLVPRTAVATVESIEVCQSTIGVNGTIVTGSQQRQRLGADADAVIGCHISSRRRAGAAVRHDRGSAGTASTPVAPEPPPQAAPGRADRTRRRRTDARIGSVDRCVSSAMRSSTARSSPCWALRPSTAK